MSIGEDAWLASLMGMPVFRAHATNPADANAAREHAKGRTAFYFAKVDASDVAVAKELQNVGFFVVDVNVTFGVAPSALARVVAPAVEVSDVSDVPLDRRDDLLAVAHDSFRFTRFHLDPLVAKPTANLIKKEWVRSYAEKKRGDHLFVASASGRPVGFLAALTSADRSTAIIDLVGVHPDAQRRGIGRALISRFADRYAAAKELLVGTQVANAPSVQLYESMGFRLKASQYVLHMHVRDGKAL